MDQEKIQGQLPLQLPQKLQLQPPIGPTLHQQLNLQLQLQLQLQRRTTVHWPTGVHQEGVYTRWNGYCLMRGLVGQDKSYFMLARARGRILARARARLRLRALARACARAFAPTVAGACRDMTSLGPSSFGDHVVGVITQSPSQMPSWWQLYFSFNLPLPLFSCRLVLRAVGTSS